MKVTAELGDISNVEVDAVVNAANSSLLGGGGVDGAIHRAAGPQLLDACRALRATSHPAGLPVGEAVATPGFGLPARWVVHTVGPNRYAGQTEPGLLASCFRRSLDVADGLGASTIAFPAVGAGIFGWAPEEVAAIAAATVNGWHVEHPDAAIQQVRFVLFDDRTLATFSAALAV